MKALRKLAEWRQQPREYRIGSHCLILPGGHGLPRYQKLYATYDAFLPVLAEFLGSGHVIDVGANVGDTIAGMASANDRLSFTAVEPDEDFAALLDSNIALMRQTDPDLAIRTVRAFLSADLPIVGLEGKAGTRRAVLDADSASGPAEALSLNRRLDDVVAEHGLSAAALLKVDTDGFDWSVIDSGMQWIGEKRPLVYFETELGDAGEHLPRYAATLARMESAGYRDFHIFDNFGCYLTRVQSAEQAADMLGYIARQRLPGLHRAIYYFDILAAAPNHAEAAETAIAAYLARLAAR